MKVVNQYIIPFKGLKDGDHNFEFEFDKAFFDLHSDLEIIDGHLITDVVLSKKTTFLMLKTSMKGNVDLICDRCLENFSFPLRFKGQLLVKFKDEPEEPDDEVMYISPNEDLLDLNQYFFDCVGLSIPIQKYHPDNENGEPGCSKQMLRLISTHVKSEQENNDNRVDPRWSKLKDLLNDGNKNE